MARRRAPSSDRPTLEYLSHLGPHRAAVGDLSPAGMHGLVYGPVSGRGLPAIALARGWLQPPQRYVVTMRYLASWGFVVVAPHTERSPLPSHAGMARDLSLALRMVVAGKLAGGVINVDGSRMGVLGHSIGGGAATLAASTDAAIKAVVTVTPAVVRPSALVAAGNVLVPSLHLIGNVDVMGGRFGADLAAAWAGPAQLRSIKNAQHLGLSEGRHWSTAVIGNGDEKNVQRASRTLATAFFLRHLAGQEQLADELEDKVAGTTLETIGDAAELVT